MSRLESAQFYGSIIQTTAIVFAGAWAIGYGFWYSDIFRPSKNPAFVSPDLAVTIASSKVGRLAITVYADIENESKRDAHMLPASLTVIGVKNRTVTGPEDSKFQKNTFEDRVRYAIDNGIYTIEEKYHPEDKIEVVAIGIITGNNVLSSDENFTFSEVVHIPATTYDTVYVKLDFWTHNGKYNLSTNITIDQEGLLNEPCINSIISNEICKPINIEEDGAGQIDRKRYDLWEYNVVRELPVPSSIE